MTHARITHYPAPACPRLPLPAPACPRLPPPTLPYATSPSTCTCTSPVAFLATSRLTSFFVFHPIKASHGRGPGNGNVDEIVRNIATWRTTNGEEMHGYLWQVSLREIPFPA